LNSLVEIRIETGRKHQIRAHLASIGFPMVGDRQYGSPEDGQLQLAAVHLAFNHPTTGERCEYDLPVSSRPELQDAN
jgi:tRNA pseudouridine32 synthase/23S rRNA pseudouridine746 synthase